MSKMIKAIRSGDPATLFSAFLYFDISFMVWVLIGALGVYISKDLGLAPGDKGLLVSIPLLGGAFFRIILGLLVDRFGAKRVGLLSLSVLFLPLLWGWLGAVSFHQMIGVGFLLGMAGASFAVALPLASRCYPPESQGVAMGIAGAGNSGTMIAVLVGPLLAESFGWHAVFGLAIAPVALTLLLFILMAKEPPLPAKEGRPLDGYLRLIKEPDLWWFNFYYSVTFGGFVGLASFLGLFFHDQYRLSAVAAGGLTALCVFAGSFFRPIGGYWADRVGGMRLLTLLYLIAAILFGMIALLPPIAVAASLIFLGMVALGMGNGAVFQQVPQRFQKEIGLVSGIVGAAGGIGGFFLPTLLGKIKGWTGSYAGGFLLFGALALVCFGVLIFKRRAIERLGAERLIDVPVPALSLLENDGEGRVRMEVVFGG